MIVEFRLPISSDRMAGLVNLTSTMPIEDILLILASNFN
jgi:hypothetical protein